MELNGFVGEIVDERIQNLLENQMGESEGADKQWADEMDAMLEQLPTEIREMLESLLTRLMERGAEEGRYLYVSGIQDGARICKALLA